MYNISDVFNIFSELCINGTSLDAEGNFIFCFSCLVICHALVSCYLAVIAYLMCITASLTSQNMSSILADYIFSDTFSVN